MTRPRDDLLRHALTHLELMQTYASRDLTDQLVIDAICMRLSAGLEVLSGLDTETLTELFGDTWPLMWGMRNRIAHGYLLIDAGIVRQTVNNDVPPILTAIRTALS
ncbi:MAG: HepT-like ribonuclease domain-containing protein [Dermatophilaceae bacterium]